MDFTLTDEHKELKSTVRAVVTMQSPYGGAPLATDLLSDPITKAGVDRVLTLARVPA